MEFFTIHRNQNSNELSVQKKVKVVQIDPKRGKTNNKAYGIIEPSEFLNYII